MPVGQKAASRLSTTTSLPGAAAGGVGTGTWSAGTPKLSVSIILSTRSAVAGSGTDVSVWRANAAVGSCVLAPLQWLNPLASTVWHAEVWPWARCRAEYATQAPPNPVPHIRRTVPPGPWIMSVLMGSVESAGPGRAFQVAG